MECPYCKGIMTSGVIKCYRCAPMWKGVDGKKFTFGKGKMLVNTTKGVWYCEKCDCFVIKPIEGKVKI